MSSCTQRGCRSCLVRTSISRRKHHWHRRRGESSRSWPWTSWGLWRFDVPVSITSGRIKRPIAAMSLSEPRAPSSMILVERKCHIFLVIEWLVNMASSCTQRGCRLCSVSHGRRQYTGESTIGTVVVERGRAVDHERAEGSDGLTHQRRSLQVKRQANYCSYECMCRREKKKPVFEIDWRQEREQEVARWAWGPHNGIGMSDCYKSLADDYADIAEVARDVMLCWELGEVRCKEGSQMEWPATTQLALRTCCRADFRPVQADSRRKCFGWQMRPSGVLGSSVPLGLTNRLLKAIAPAVTESLTHLFNLSVKTNAFPSDWKHALVTPIFKNRDDNQLPSNCRPVSILPALGNILDNIQSTFLLKYLEEYHLLSNHQFGFQASLSTTKQLVHITHQWISNLNSKKDTLAVFMDFHKAFDRVWHNGLLYKLGQLGISHSALSWLQDYLTNRTLSVKVGQSRSPDYQLLAGVLQGSHPGPVLFLAYINNPPTVVTSPADLYAYNALLHDTVEQVSTRSNATSTRQSRGQQLGEVAFCRKKHLTAYWKPQQVWRPHT